MVGPLIGCVAGAGAQGDHTGAHGGSGCDQDLQPLLAQRAHGRIGVDQVIGARHRRNRNAGLVAGIGHCGGLFGGQMVGHRRKSGTRHVILHRGKARRFCRLQYCHRITAWKGFGENTKSHQSGPDTSAKRTGCPLRADCAMATIARTDAMPSSMFAPVWGVPFRIVSAKPSTWRR